MKIPFLKRVYARYLSNRATIMPWTETGSRNESCLAKQLIPAFQSRARVNLNIKNADFERQSDLSFQRMDFTPLSALRQIKQKEKAKLYGSLR